MKIVSPAIQRRQLTDQVIQRFQEMISVGELKVGTKLPSESELMTQLGVGRSTLREAVRVLAHMGLLEVRQGDGTYVRARTAASEPLERRLQRATLLEVYEVRYILELEIAKLAAERREDTDLAQMRACLEKRKAAKHSCDEAGFLDADVAFHIAVANASKNAVLVDMYQSFTTALRDALGNLLTDAEIDRGDQELLHEQLFDAIAQGDPTIAQQRTAEFLEAITQQLRSFSA